MGLNFERTIKAKVGDIIHPAYNGTNGFWKRSRWDLILAVNERGNISERRCIWNFNIVLAIQCVIELMKRKGLL